MILGRVHLRTQRAVTRMIFVRAPRTLFSFGCRVTHNEYDNGTLGRGLLRLFLSDYLIVGKRVSEMCQILSQNAETRHCAVTKHVCYLLNGSTIETVRFGNGFLRNCRYFIFLSKRILCICETQRANVSSKTIRLKKHWDFAIVRKEAGNAKCLFL